MITIEAVNNISNKDLRLIFKQHANRGKKLAAAGLKLEPNPVLSNHLRGQKKKISGSRLIKPKCFVFKSRSWFCKTNLNL